MDIVNGIVNVAKGMGDVAASVLGAKPTVSGVSAPAKAAPIKVIPRVANGDKAKFEKLKEWLRANEVKLAEETLADDDRLSHHALAVYPAVKGGCLAYGAGCFAATDPDAPVYVLGDTHGDFDSCLALFLTILGMAKENGESDPIVYLLGDILDRNGEGCMLECALILAILQRKVPETMEGIEDWAFGDLNSIRLGIVKGDHDSNIRYPEVYDPAARFVAPHAHPADYTDWLNSRLDEGCGENATKIALAWLRLMLECPSAVFLERSGTLLAHGGVPRIDIQDQIKKGVPYLLQSEQSCKDYQWCRMKNIKATMLNRSSTASEVGASEFDSFCKLVFPDGNGGSRVHRFIFGHQHSTEGFEQYDKGAYVNYEVIKITSFCASRILGEMTMFGVSQPHFARVVSFKNIVEYDALAGEDRTIRRLENVNIYSLSLSFEMEPVEVLDSEAIQVVEDCKGEQVAVKPVVQSIVTEPSDDTAHQSVPAVPTATPVPEKKDVQSDVPVVKTSESLASSSVKIVVSPPPTIPDALVDKAKELIGKHGMEVAKQHLIEAVGEDIAREVFALIK